MAMRSTLPASACPWSRSQASDRLAAAEKSAASAGSREPTSLPWNARISALLPMPSNAPLTSLRASEATCCRSPVTTSFKFQRCAAGIEDQYPRHGRLSLTLRRLGSITITAAALPTSLGSSASSCQFAPGESFPDSHLSEADRCSWQCAPSLPDHNYDAGDGGSVEGGWSALCPQRAAASAARRINPGPSVIFR